MKVKKVISYCLVLCICLGVLNGCRSIEHPRVREAELDQAPETVSLEPQDIRRTVEKMAESLLVDPAVREYAKETRPVLDIEPMKNRTQNVIDMKGLTDSIRTRLIRSRMFRFVDQSTAGSDIALMDNQAQLGLTDTRKAIKPGRQSAAQMYLTGSLTDMVGRSDRRVDHYYKFSMILKDLSTGEIVWSDEQEIRKIGVSR